MVHLGPDNNSYCASMGYILDEDFFGVLCITSIKFTHEDYEDDAMDCQSAPCWKVYHEICG